MGYSNVYEIANYQRTNEEEWVQYLCSASTMQQESQIRKSSLSTPTRSDPNNKSFDQKYALTTQTILNYPNLSKIYHGLNYSKSKLVNFCVISITEHQEMQEMHVSESLLEK